MADRKKFIEELNKRYASKGQSIILGKGILEDEIIPEVNVNIPLKTINRHGLIAGATGTGKTKTLQAFVEQLSHASIPSLVMDIKGDLSGIAAAGEKNIRIKERYEKTKLPYQPQAFPAEFLSLSAEKGIRLRATVTEFGPVLLSKILGLNNTQSSIISIVFKYCNDRSLPLIDLDDLKKVLQYVTDDTQGRKEFSEDYGSISPASLGAILRSIIALEQQGATQIFGEPSFDIPDLLKTREGKGVVNVLRVIDIQNKPTLFSTFMLSLFTKIYMTLPEEGDLDKPKLVVFIDEAHLIFKEASRTLLDQIETMVKLIRSKGVGIYFITQIPRDIPGTILSQLGLKIQHALRGFTARDKKEINKVVENYPTTEYYKASELIQSLGIGEAFVTALDEKGIPTPLVHTYLISPESRMDILTPDEINTLVNNSILVSKYNIDINKYSAYEILMKRIDGEDPISSSKNQEIGNTPQNPKNQKEGPNIFESILKSSMTQTFGKTLMREVAKAILGMIGLKSTTKRNSRK